MKESGGDDHGRSPTKKNKFAQDALEGSNDDFDFKK
jgi:hypothetical protein